MIWRQRETDTTCGNGLSSSPPIRSSSAGWSGRAPAISTPLSRKPHRNSALGVSRLSSLAISSERDGPCFDHLLSAVLVSASVAMSRASASECWSPSSLPTTVDRAGSAESCLLTAGAPVTIRPARCESTAHWMIETRYFLASPWAPRSALKAIRNARPLLYAIAHAIRSHPPSAGHASALQADP
jgi:hypothetical protein